MASSNGKSQPVQPSSPLRVGWLDVPDSPTIRLRFPKYEDMMQPEGPPLTSPARAQFHRRAASSDLPGSSARPPSSWNRRGNRARQSTWPLRQPPPLPTIPDTTDRSPQRSPASPWDQETVPCIRCQRLGRRCTANDLTPCVGCTEAHAAHPMNLRIPCFRACLKDVALFRTGPEANSTTKNEACRLSALSTGLPNTTKTIELSQVPGSATLSVVVQEFVPAKVDATWYGWRDINGAHRRLQMPSYALASPAVTERSIQAYMDANMSAYLGACLQPANYVVSRIFDMAVKRAKSGSRLLQDVLKFWVASRIMEDPWRIAGQETLGMEEIADRRSMFFGKIPVTPIMETQLSQIVVRQFLHPLRLLLLQQLEASTINEDKIPFAEVLWTVFILLNSIELATAHERKVASTCGLMTPYRGSRYGNYIHIDTLFRDAQILIAHYRDMFVYHVPLTRIFTEMKSRSLLQGLSDDEVKILRDITNHLREEANTYTLLKQEGKYESQLYWCHQLFYTRWDPAPIEISEAV